MSKFTTVQWKSLVKSADKEKEKNEAYRFGSRVFYDRKDPYENFTDLSYALIGEAQAKIGEDDAII